MVLLCVVTKSVCQLYSLTHYRTHTSFPHLLRPSLPTGHTPHLFTLPHPDPLLPYTPISLNSWKEGPPFPKWHLVRVNLSTMNLRTEVMVDLGRG